MLRLLQPAPQKASLQLFRAADGMLLLFPVAGRYILPEPEILLPPYVHESVGRLVLDMAERWFDPPERDGPPEQNFWTAVPKCRSYRAFHRSHQLIGIKAEKRSDDLKLSLRYMPRKDDGSYTVYAGEVEVSCQISHGSGESEKKLDHHIGSAVGQMFRLAEVLDPLLSPATETKP